LFFVNRGYPPLTKDKKEEEFVAFFYSLEIVFKIVGGVKLFSSLTSPHDSAQES